MTQFGPNTVEFVGYYGGDKTHALSAWTSTHRELTEEREARIPELLKFLAENKHHTPFEKSALHFLVTCDTASHIHLLKHRIGVSVNGESARYKELQGDKAYEPYDWPIEGIIDEYYEHVDYSFDAYHRILDKLVEQGVDRKRAKESARFFLPYGQQIKLDIMFNFRSFMHFQGLRNKEDAQEEIQHIADSMLEYVRGIPDDPFKYSAEAFGY